MRRTILTVSWIFGLALQMNAADLSVQITACSSQLPKGAPACVLAEAHNISGRALDTAGRLGLQWHISRTDAPQSLNCPPRDEDLTIARCKKGIIAQDWYQMKRMELDCFSEPGTWSVQAYVFSQGECNKIDPQGRVLERVQGWKGDVRSSEVLIQVIEPTGIDKEVYVATHGRPMAAPKELIKKYPTSTYTAYALLDKEYGFLPTEDDLKSDRLATIRKLALWTLNPAEVQDAHVYGHQDKAKTLDHIALLQTVLAAHPNFPFRYAFEYCLGMEYFSVYDFKNARAFFERCLDPNVPAPIRVVSQVHLDVLTEKKL